MVLKRKRRITWLSKKQLINGDFKGKKKKSTPILCQENRGKFQSMKVKYLYKRGREKERGSRIFLYYGGKAREQTRQARPQRSFLFILIYTFGKQVGPIKAFIFLVEATFIKGQNLVLLPNIFGEILNLVLVFVFTKKK